ncbi:unnamed protein product [Brassicogethes aeneus]|uniref:Uncharacterized protein n=1 Tax=Brassicogethes aeneus TaxID=1431903 RepID=A0A9P0ARC1_BRAAE|nr:unnamed protein product [Brassicogethes aeneus]
MSSNKLLFSRLLLRTLTTKTDAAVSVKKPGDIETENADMQVRYNVCQEKTATVYKIDGHRTQVPPKLSLELQDLQPSMHPQYYSSHSESSPSLVRGTEAESKNKSSTEETLATRYRNLMDSNTKKNITQPLKMSKLAKPFPDPVKVMSSHIISDQEKAEQMLAESRSQDFYRKP